MQVLNKYKLFFKINFKLLFKFKKIQYAKSLIIALLLFVKLFNKFRSLLFCEYC